MRLTLVALCVIAIASAADAGVRVTTRADGGMVIEGAGGAVRNTNWQWLARQRDRRSQYDPLIERYSSRYGVDPTLVRAVIQIESNFDPNCISKKGARGLMQLMPDTAKRYGVRRLHDPDENIRGGVAYLADLMAMFNSDLRRALAAYNAGEGAVTRYGGIPPYGETTTYVQRALTVYYGRALGEGATSFAGSRSGPKLRGGRLPVAAAIEPVALIPGMRYLGSQ